MKHVKTKFLVIVAMLFLSMPFLLAEEILLAKYDFSTQSKVPTQQATGVTFGAEFAVFKENETFPCEMSITDDGYLMVRGYTTGVRHNHYGYISITPDPGKTVRITKIIIADYKEPGSNTNRCRCHLYDMGGAAPNGTPTVLTNLIHQGGGGRTIPETLTTATVIPSAEIDFNSIKFMSFYATQTTQNEELSKWKIRTLEFYGEIISQGEIAATKSIDFGEVQVGDKADKNVSMVVVGGTSKNVGIELLDNTSGAFICMQTEVESADATAGTTIKVSFSPPAPGSYTAQLKLSYDDKVSYTSLSGISPIMNENFTEYVSDDEIMNEMSGTAINTYEQENYLKMPGWEFSNEIYWHKSGLYGLGLEMHGTNEEAAKITTPELDLSMPFGMNFMMKKMDNDATTLGNLYITVDSDTIFSNIAPNNIFTSNSAVGFIGKANSKISFLGINNENNKIAVDEISIFPINDPALSLPAYSSKFFDSENGVVTIDIPFTGYQLTSDITAVLNGSPEGYEVLTPTITKAAAEAGSNVQVKFTPPTGGTPVDAELRVQGGGLSHIRIINLRASSASGITEKTINATVSSKSGCIYVEVEGIAMLEVYSVNGKSICKKQIIEHAAIKVDEGLYIVRITDNTGNMTGKVFVK